jgi:hypothetical protein
MKRLAIDEFTIKPAVAHSRSCRERNHIILTDQPAVMAIVSWTSCGTDHR